MENHLKLSDSQFIDQFNNCQLKPSDFTHLAHLRLAWINIKQLGIEKAEIEIQLQLKRYVDFIGAIDKYNTTLTIAALKTVHHFELKSKTDNFLYFIEENPILHGNFRDLLNSHYSFDIFENQKAKSHFLSPDVLPFDS